MSAALKEVTREFRTQLLLKCYECRSITRVHTQEPMICANCGHGFLFECFSCGCRFEPEILCTRCHWWICPKCGSCGCMFNGRIKPFENAEISSLSDLTELM